MLRRRSGPIKAFLDGVPDTGDADNVVKIRLQSWDDLENEIHAATNELVHWEAEAGRVQTGYNTALQRLETARRCFAERCKEVGGRVEFSSRGMTPISQEFVSDEE